MVSAVLRFPGERLASFTCSFGAHNINQYQLVGTDAILKQSQPTTTRAACSGRSGKAAGKKNKPFQKPINLPRRWITFPLVCQESGP